MKKLLFLLLNIVALGASAQVAVTPFRTPRATFTDPNGVPLANGCVFTYQGGTSTPLATYTSSSGSTPNSNPVILDSTGSAVMWLGASSYKFVGWSSGGANCSTGVLQWTVDNVPGNIFLNGTISGAAITGGTITDAAISGGTIDNTAITNSTVDSTPIGQTTPSSGSFTSITGALDALNFSSTPVFNAGAYSYFTMTLTGNVPSSIINGGHIGQLITFDICQNGTGQVVNGQTTGFTFAWPASYFNPPVVNPVLNSCTIATAYFNGSSWITVSSNTQLLLGNFDNLTFTSTPIFQASSYSNFALTLTNNVNSSTITGGINGQVATIDICQNSTGNYQFVWPANLLYAPPVSANASSCTGIVAVYNGTDWITVGSSTNSTTTPLTGNLQQIPFTATPTFAAATYSSFAMTLSGNVTSSTISGGTTGQLISIVLTQGSSTTTGPPSAPTFSTLTTGGSLPGSTTFYAVCSWVTGTVESLPSAEASETTGSGSTNTVTWNCPVGAGVTAYKFYIGATTGAEAYYFTSSTASYIQIGMPSTGIPGMPLTGSTYTVSWPSNLINAPTMSNGIGAATGLIALYNGTNWEVVGTSGGTVYPTFQQVTITSGLCTTPASAYATCTFTGTFPRAFADTSYSVVCSPNGAAAARAITGTFAAPTSATAFTVTIQNGFSTGGSATTPSQVECIGVHN